MLLYVTQDETIIKHNSERLRNFFIIKYSCDWAILVRVVKYYTGIIIINYMQLNQANMLAHACLRRDNNIIPQKVWLKFSKLSEFLC